MSPSSPFKLCSQICLSHLIFGVMVVGVSTPCELCSQTGMLILTDLGCGGVKGSSILSLSSSELCSQI